MISAGRYDKLFFNETQKKNYIFCVKKGEKELYNKNAVLIMGNCGVGKTWVMKQLLDTPNKPYKLGKFNFHETDNYIVVGKYDNSTFEGSDKLSMSVITDLNLMLRYLKKVDKIAIFEGDRFTNSKFIEKAEPIIIKINGDGKKGRDKRGSNQSERHLKSIRTRISNINSHKDVHNSEDCLKAVKILIQEYDRNRIKTH